MGDELENSIAGGAFALAAQRIYRRAPKERKSFMEHPRFCTLAAMNTAQRQEYWAALALRYTAGIGACSQKQLVEQYGSAYAAIEQVDAWHNVQHRAAVQSNAWRSPARAEWDSVGAAGYKILLWTDPRYPARLKALNDPPLFLYYLGDASLFSAPCLAVVGARRCTRYGLDKTKELCAELSQSGITIVSGMARGIDREAHKSSLPYLGRSIAVLGTGPDRIYPIDNRDVFYDLAENGLLLTSFCPNIQPEAHNFPVRNRIISGLSLGIIVIEAAERSGSLITARHALEQGRDVFAVPGRVAAQTSSGCHALARDGAQYVQSAEDVLRLLAPQLVAFGTQKDKLAHYVGAAGELVCAQGKAADVLPHEAIRVVPQQLHENIDENVDANMDATVEAQHEAQSYAPDSKAPCNKAACSDEDALCAALAKENGTAHIDVLCRGLQWDAGRVSTTLLLLEVAGRVRHLAGMRYELLE